MDQRARAALENGVTLKSVAKTQNNQVDCSEGIVRDFH